MSQLPAGRELDVLIAEKVMGLTLKHVLFLPYYSTDIATAWEVVFVFIRRGYTLRLVGPKIPDTTGYLIEEKWSAAFVEPQYAFTDVGQSQGRGVTPSLAICHAALEIVKRNER